MSLRSITHDFEVVAGRALTLGVVTIIQTVGERINLHPHLCAYAHREKIKKASLVVFPLRIVVDKLRRIPSKGRAEMIRKV